MPAARVNELEELLRFPRRADRARWANVSTTPHRRSPTMKIRPPVAVALGTAAGLLAAGLVYSASAGASPNESPASAVLPRVATTTTVTPAAQPTCSGKAELEHGVCVVTVDETATTAPSTSAGHQGFGSEHSSTPR